MVYLIQVIIRRGNVLPPPLDTVECEPVSVEPAYGLDDGESRKVMAYDLGGEPSCVHYRDRRRRH